MAIWKLEDETFDSSYGQTYGNPADMLIAQVALSVAGLDYGLFDHVKVVNLSNAQRPDLDAGNYVRKHPLIQLNYEARIDCCAFFIPLSALLPPSPRLRRDEAQDVPVRPCHTVIKISSRD